jgi:hypothetical protein
MSSLLGDEPNHPIEVQTDSQYCLSSLEMIARCLTVRMPPTPSVFAKTVSVVALVATLPPSATAQVGPSHRGDLTFTLECRDSSQIGFTVKNVGATDTTLRLGTVLGNGSKHMVDDLDLVVKLADGQTLQARYGPRDYPGVVGGTLTDWLEPLPARAAYSMSAKANDFYQGLTQRLAAFPAGAELSLRWVIRDPPPRAMLLAYWSGTLASNSCTPAQ